MEGKEKNLKPAKAAQMLEYVVIVDGHNHAGQPVDKGAKLKLPESVGEMLVKAKALKPAK